MPLVIHVFILGVNGSASAKTVLDQLIVTVPTSRKALYQDKYYTALNQEKEGPFV